MKILITGGAGFIGKALSKKLLGQGHQLTILDNLSEQTHGKNQFEDIFKESVFKSSIQFVNGDVRNKRDLKKVLNDQDVVVHLAAETGTGQSMYLVDKYVDVNVGGTSNLFQVMIENEIRVKKVIVFSSRAIYGEGKYRCLEHGIVYPEARDVLRLKGGDFGVKCPVCQKDSSVIPTNEDSKIHPTSVYGFTKHSQEELSMIMGKALNIPVVVIRPQNVYGPGQSLKNPYTGILSIFSTLIKNQQKINIFEDGLETRDFVYIDDIVTGTILAIHNDSANFQSFNIGSGVATSVLEVTKELIKLYNGKENYELTGQFRIGDIRNNFADISKAKNILGYEAKTDVARGLKNFVTWVDSQEVEKIDIEESFDEMRAKNILH